MAKKKRPKWTRFRQMLGAVATVGFAAARAVRADQYVWNGATGNFTDPDWTDSNNPVVHTPPGAGDGANFPVGTITFSGNTTATAAVTGATKFNLAGNYSVSGNLNLSGPLTVVNHQTLSAASLTQSGGPTTFTSASFAVGTTASLDADFTATGGGTQTFGRLLVGNNAATNNTISLTGVTVASGSTGIDTLGVVAGASSTFTADSSPWTASSGFKIGLDGAATLTLQNGATLQNTAVPAGADLFIGGYIDPDTTAHQGLGIVNVNGAGSQLTDAKGIISGVAGDGTLSLLAGGKVTTPTVLVAQAASAVGRVELDGAGSTLTLTGAMEIGRLGNGQMIVTNGAVVSSASGLVASGVNSVGTAQVDGLGAAWNIAGALQMGQAGLAISTILNGATITVGGTTVLADQSTANTTMEVNGTDTNTNTPSTLVYTGDLHVGEHGAGELDVQAGALVKPAGSGAGLVVVAAQSGSVGTVTADGAGSLLKASDFYLGGTASAIGGTGQATLTDGGAIVALHSLHIYSGSNLDVSGGAGPAGSTVVGTGAATTGRVTVASGGTLSGSGSITGNLLSIGGVVSPGDSVGRLTVSGNVQENAGGNVLLEVASISQLDQLDAVSNLNIGGTVTVDFINGFLPTTGQSFELFLDATTTNFTPTTQFEGIGPGFGYQWVQVAGGWDLQALNNAVPVPEPTAMLVPLGMIALLRRRRGKAKRFSSAITR